MRTNCGLYIYTALIVVLGSLSSCQWLPEVGKVSLSESSVTLKVGGSRQLSATVEPAAAEYDGITWSTSDRSVVSVSNGTIVAEKVGSATVTASAEGVTSAPCTVTVQAINVTGVYLNYSAIEITEGQSTSLNATVTPSDATDQSVQWSSGNTSVATVSGGSIKAVAPGKTTITIRTNDGGKTASCQVTVKAKVIPVTGVWIDQSTLSLTEGESGQLKATVSPSNATNKNVTWSSSNTSVATVSSNGTVTAKKAGTATITVKTADQGKTATCNVTVTAKNYPVTGVSLSQSSLALIVGETSQLTATVSPSNATNKDVSWSSSKTSVATVSSDGTVTAKAVGSATITVTTADGSKKATCVVTVQSVSVTGVSLNPSTMSLVVGSTGTLTATVSPSNATNKAVTYSSSNPAVAKASSDGVVTALAAGSTTITVKTADGSKTATCRVTVTRATVAVTGVSLDKTATTIETGKTKQLTATITPENATNKNISWSSSNEAVATVSPSNATNKGVTWSSNNTSVATVSSSGVVTAKAAGSATITVRTTDGYKTATCSVTVKNATISVTGVSVSKTSLSLTEGQTSKLSATVSPSNASNKAVTWSSSNAAVAMVDGNGNVTARGHGTATITVTTEDQHKTASCIVHVRPRDPIEAFVYRMYRVCLLRDPDPNGFAFWVDMLRSGKCTGAEMANGFYTSEEMINHHYANSKFVTLAYNGIMDRGPDGGGLAHWTSLLDQGVSYQYIISGFTVSNEFTELCRHYGIVRGTVPTVENRDLNAGITGFVSRLYTKILGRGAELEGLNHWCGILNQNSVKSNFLEVALNGFLHSNEFLEKNLNDTEYVKVLYRTFLDREAEPAGLQHWLDELAAGKTRDSIAREFSISNEFSNIMASYGIQ